MMAGLFFFFSFPDKVKLISNSYSGSRKEEGGGEVNYFPPLKNTIARKELSDSLVPGQQDVKIHA